MNISWRYIDLNTSLFEINDNSQIYVEEDSSILIITNARTTSVIHFDPLTFKTKTSEVIFDNVGRHFVFSNSGTMYNFNANGTLLRLLCTSNVSIDHGSVFGSSGSSASEVFSWTKVFENAGKVVSATGVSNGFAAITENSGFYSCNLYDNLDKPSIQCSKRLQVTDQPDWKMFSFKSNKLSQQLMKHIFGELSLVLTDLIVLSTPTGTVFLFPVLADKTVQDFVPIYCDTDKLVYVAISPCKNAFILFYQNGRIVFITLEDKAIVYKKFFLSTSIKTTNIISQDLKFSIIWSDGITTYYTIPNTLNDFLFSERTTSIRGIVKMEKINNKVLLFNVNGCAYLAELNSNFVGVNYSDPNLKAAIIELSKNIDQIKQSCQIAESHFDILKTEQTDITQLKLTIENNTLFIENLSSSIFVKEKWSVFLETKNNFKNLTKIQRLTDDFCHSDKILCPLESFLNIGCTTLKVSLIARLYENQRLLCLVIGSLNILSNIMEIND